MYPFFCDLFENETLVVYLAFIAPHDDPYLRPVASLAVVATFQK